LPKIINVDQTGYEQNRFIGFNLKQIQDIIDYADIYKIEGAIIVVDFTKVSLEAMNSTDKTNNKADKGNFDEILLYS
jgi:uncharacterized lipoprotein YehR (DUF1307 family)